MRRLLIVVLALLILLVAARVALPYALRGYVEKVLGRLEGYASSVRDVDVALWRGAYAVEGVTIDETGVEGERTPFVYVERADIAVEWGALVDGELVARIRLDQPVLNVERPPGAPPEDAVPTEDAPDWRARVRELAPFRLNRFEIRDGFVHYADPTADPRIDMNARDLHLILENLSNVREEADTAFATLRARAETVGGGSFAGVLRIDPLATSPTFDLEASLKGVDLTELNDFFRKYGDFDLEEGRGDLFVELAAADGRIEGYVKPMLQNLEVLAWSDEEKADGLTDKFWEGLVGAAGELIENQPEDMLAARIPLAGTIEDPAADAWTMVASLLRNAFVRALVPGIDDTVGLWRVSGVRMEGGA